MTRQYYIEVKDGYDFRIIDLEYNPNGTKLGNLIKYPTTSLFSEVVIADTIKDAFSIGIDLLETKQALHYAKLGSKELKNENISR